MSGVPMLSVVVPAYQAEATLPDTLGALLASELPRDRWELIVVDDASRDATGTVASRYADQVVALKGSPRGPGHARNAGAAMARGRWLVFVDADVRVHRDTLDRFAAAIYAHPETAVVFGAYDAHPAAMGLVSQYRNLLHRYVHLAGAGPAETFWAGLGAVRRDVFLRAGGFDTRRYPRPQIEDIELGYRLRDQGERIRLEPDIQGTHLKQWTFRTMVRTDFWDRGLPWMRLLLERSDRPTASLNVGWKERVKVGIAGVALLCPLAAVGLEALWPLTLMGASVVVLAAWSLPVYRWFVAQRGVAFTLAVLPLHLAYYGTNAVAAATATLQHLWGRLRAVEPVSAA